MAKSDSRSSRSGRSKQVVPLTIAEEIAIFLKSGGKIQQIPTGVSGQVNLAGPKHIKLGNKSSEAANKTSEAVNTTSEAAESGNKEAKTD